MADDYATLRCTNCRHPIASLTLLEAAEMGDPGTGDHTADTIPRLPTQSRSTRQPAAESTRVMRLRLRHLDQEAVL